MSTATRPCKDRKFCPASPVGSPAALVHRAPNRRASDVHMQQGPDQSVIALARPSGWRSTEALSASTAPSGDGGELRPADASDSDADVSLGGTTKLAVRCPSGGWAPHADESKRPDTCATSIDVARAATLSRRAQCVVLDGKLRTNSWSMPWMGARIESNDLRRRAGSSAAAVPRRAQQIDRAERERRNAMRRKTRVVANTLPLHGFTGLMGLSHHPEGSGAGDQWKKSNYKGAGGELQHSATTHGSRHRATHGPGGQWRPRQWYVHPEPQPAV